MFFRRPIHAVISTGLILFLPFTGARAQKSAGASAAPATVKRALIQADHAEAVYRRLIEHHWSPRTGLFYSFPDSLDQKLSQQASTYEQGAMGLLAIRFGDLERADALFDFLKRSWDGAAQKPERQGMRGLANFYNAEFGGEGIEKTVHVGPNAWAALFAAKLANTAHNKEALQWALDVAYWIANVVPHENGAVAMGPRDEPGGAPWTRIYSTENNLSYYALLTELLRSPVMEKDQRASITQERDRVENWLLNTAYDRSQNRLNRGMLRGGADKVQALDTVTWFVSAIGPRRLAAKGIDVERLLKTAEKAFEVAVADKTGVDSTDQEEADIVYAQQRSRREAGSRPDSDRHRLIWYEGLGQYILAWSALADHARLSGKKELAVRAMEKAGALTRAFDQAALKRAEKQAAYPYATPGRFFRDGWTAPQESADGPAASLISGVWRCFAGLGWDPLAGRELGSVAAVAVRAPQAVRLAERKPGVLYGTSEDMTTHAWRMLNDRNWDMAVEQAQATIQEWSAWALRLQEKKMREVGQVIPYSGSAEDRKKIFQYWALNDVGAAYFILGKAYDEKGAYEQAARAFQQVVTHYNLAQIWDPQGWFWSPVDAISSEYVTRNPDHYARVIPQVYAEGSKYGKTPN